MLELGLDVNAVNDEGNTPLILATICLAEGASNCAALLLQSRQCTTPFYLPPTPTHPRCSLLPYPHWRMARNFHCFSGRKHMPSLFSLLPQPVPILLPQSECGAGEPSRLPRAALRERRGEHAHGPPPHLPSHSRSPPFPIPSLGHTFRSHATA